MENHPCSAGVVKASGITKIFFVPFKVVGCNQSFLMHVIANKTTQPKVILLKFKLSLSLKVAGKKHYRKQKQNAKLKL